MKKVFLLFALLFSISIGCFGQDYVTQLCPICNGNKVVIVGYDYYGYPVYNSCGYCRGNGYIVVPVNNPTFRGGTNEELQYIGSYEVASGTAGEKEFYSTNYIVYIFKDSYGNYKARLNSKSARDQSVIPTTSYKCPYKYCISGPMGYYYYFNIY